MSDRVPVVALAREVAALAWPAVVQGLLSTVVLFTDRLLLGHLSEDALGSMQISGPLIWSVFSVCGAFGSGIVAVVGRAVGAGEADRARRTVRVSLAFAALLGLAVAVAGVLLRAPLGLLMAGSDPASQPVRELANTFMGVLFLAAPFQLLGAAAMTALQAGGDTRTPMRVSIAAGFLNLLVSWALLFGKLGLPALGIAGSALGSVTAYVVHAAVLLWVLSRRRGPVSLRPAPGPLLPALRPVLRVSGPTLGEKLIFHTGFLIFAGIVGHLGQTAMAANQGLLAIESLGYIGASGFGVAAGALVAQKLGAGRTEDAARVGWVSAALGAAALGTVSLLFVAVPARLVGAFSQDPEVLALGVRCLRVAAVAQPLMALTEALSCSLRGAGDTRSPMAVALVGPVGVRLAACWFLAVHLDMGLLGIWIGTTLDWAVRTGALAVVWGRGRWRWVVIAGV